MKTIYYYFPKEGVKNKAGNALLTFDWFKKKFRLPLDMDYFNRINYIEEGETFEIPYIKDIVAITDEDILWQGQVEAIIRQKSLEEGEIVRILLCEIKKSL
jgi:hypothetical protein